MEQSYTDIALRFWSDFSAWRPPHVVSYTILSFGMLSSWIITRFVATAPMLAAPICFLILTVCAMITNFAAKGVIVFGASDLQKALIFTVIGQGLAGFALLAAFNFSGKGKST
jgi:hypothetical protein